jgi:hypothetical protein
VVRLGEFVLDIQGTRGGRDREAHDMYRSGRIGRRFLEIRVMGPSSLDIAIDFLAGDWFVTYDERRFLSLCIAPLLLAEGECHVSWSIVLVAVAPFRKPRFAHLGAERRKYFGIEVRVRCMIYSRSFVAILNGQNLDNFDQSEILVDVESLDVGSEALPVVSRRTLLPFQIYSESFIF